MADAPCPRAPGLSFEDFNRFFAHKRFTDKEGERVVSKQKSRRKRIWAPGISPCSAPAGPQVFPETLRLEKLQDPTTGREGV